MFLLFDDSLKENLKDELNDQNEITKFHAEMEKEIIYIYL